ncbi:MAG TPA: type II toxin-antitoxin system PemK/MazF family toxin [Solirubrobacterales bacterium]|nr:type II toxin-antitoxin system PemK/MazF family toxin [Solirubrobacterales bacterium]
MTEPPRRGEIFLADLDPVVGHEQWGQRPFMVLSLLSMNKAPAGLVIGLPLTTTERPSSLHVRIEPGESGLPRVSYAMPEMVRSISTERIGRQFGRANRKAFELASARAGFLIGLGRKKF